MISYRYLHKYRIVFLYVFVYQHMFFQGVELLKNLTHLCASTNLIGNANEVESLPRLTILDLHGNAVSSVTIFLCSISFYGKLVFSRVGLFSFLLWQVLPFHIPAELSTSLLPLLHRVFRIYEVTLNNHYSFNYVLSRISTRRKDVALRKVEPISSFRC